MDFFYFVCKYGCVSTNLATFRAEQAKAFLFRFLLHVPLTHSFTKRVTMLISLRLFSQKNDEVFSWSVLNVCRLISRTAGL